MVYSFNRSSRSSSCRFQNRLDDLHITRAAAEISTDGLPHLSLSGMRVAVQEGLGGQNHSWDAKATLNSAALNKGFLQTIQFPILSKTFDGRDLFSLSLHSENQAGEKRLAIKQYRATAAVSQIAALLRARKAEVLREHLDQSAVGIDKEIVVVAVDP